MGVGRGTSPRPIESLPMVLRPEGKNFDECHASVPVDALPVSRRFGAAGAALTRLSPIRRSRPRLEPRPMAPDMSARPAARRSLVGMRSMRSILPTSSSMRDSPMRRWISMRSHLTGRCCKSKSAFGRPAAGTTRPCRHARSWRLRRLRCRRSTAIRNRRAPHPRRQSVRRIPEACSGDVFNCRSENR